MRLWKAQHTSFREKKGIRRADGRRARLEVEALDQRLLPTSFQWGIGRAVTLLSYDLPTHNAGALVSSHQVSGASEIVVTKDNDSTAVRQAHSSAGMSCRPVESISLDFATELIRLRRTVGD
jgi:hypothetical protein